MKWNTRKSGERDADAGDVADDLFGVRSGGVVLGGLGGVLGVLGVLGVVVRGSRHLARAHGVEGTRDGGVLRFCHRHEQ